MIFRLFEKQFEKKNKLKDKHKKVKISALKYSLNLTFLTQYPEQISLLKNPSATPAYISTSMVIAKYQ